MKKSLASICLVQWFSIGDFRKSIVARLSTNNSGVNFGSTKNFLPKHSFKIQSNQINSLTVSVIDTNSYSMVERQTLFCLAVCHMTGEAHNKTSCLPMNVLSSRFDAK